MECIGQDCVSQDIPAITFNNMTGRERLTSGKFEIRAEEISRNIVDQDALWNGVQSVLPQQSPSVRESIVYCLADYSN